jgi:hypothetical protein
MNSRTAGASFDLTKIFELPGTADKMRVGKHFGANGGRDFDPSDLWVSQVC